MFKNGKAWLWSRLFLCQEFIQGDEVCYREHENHPKQVAEYIANKRDAKFGTMVDMLI